MLGGVSSAFDLMTQRMDYLKQRHAVVAQNVANADSPGFIARDLQSFDKIMNGNNIAVTPVRVSVTNQVHIAPEGKMAPDYAMDPKNKAYEIVPTGNSVILEEQMMKVAEISSDYQLMTSLYKRTQNLVRTALGRV